MPESKFFPERPKGNIIEGWPDPTQPSQKVDFVDKIEYCLNKHSLKPLHIYCPNNHFEEILELIKKPFYQYSYHYRIDPFNEYTVLRCYRDSPKLFLHFGLYNEDMLKKAQKHNSNHFFCGVQNPYDPNGRHIKMRYGYDSWLSPEVWYNSIN